MTQRRLRWRDIEHTGLHVDDDGDGGTFVLRSLHQAPYCSGGAAVSGELTGCFRYP